MKRMKIDELKNMILTDTTNEFVIDSYDETRKLFAVDQMEYNDEIQDYEKTGEKFYKTVPEIKQAYKDTTGQVIEISFL